MVSAFFHRVIMIESQIAVKLKDIERHYEVRVLLAVESGSRAWGFASPDSDYDVRFIYVHPKNCYLKLQEGRDVIEELDPDDILDVSGWDLKKALTLLGNGNCSIAEWLGSPVTYYKDENFFREINGLKYLYFRKVSAVNHYYHMAMNHDKRYLEKRGCELKRFMYHIRGLLAAKWVMEKGTYPPVPFRELVEAEVDDDSIQNELRELVRIKSQSKEYDKCIVNDMLIEYASVTADKISAQLGGFQADRPADFYRLDNFFLREIEKTNH